MESLKFGEYLRSLRKDKGLTLKELAGKSKVSQSYITNVENEKRGIPSPDILEKLAAALNIEYTDIMIKAGYWKEEYSNDDKKIFEEIYNDRWKVVNQLTEVLKVIADDDGIFPDYLHEDLFNIFGGWLPRQEDGQWDFDEKFTVFLKRTDDEISNTDIEEMHGEFNKIYNYTTVKNGFKEYSGSNKYHNDFLNELENLIIKHEISVDDDQGISHSGLDAVRYINQKLNNAENEAITEYDKYPLKPVFQSPIRVVFEEDITDAQIDENGDVHVNIASNRLEILNRFYDIGYILKHRERALFNGRNLSEKDREFLIDLLSRLFPHRQDT